MKNVIAFYGADNKVGTTMISQAVSNVLAKQNKKVLLMHFDGNPGVEYSGKHQYCLDDIRPQLVSGLLNIDDIYNLCSRNGNLYSIKGANNYLERKKYTPKQGEALLKIVSEEFDLVIIDVGNADTGLNIAAIENSDHNFLITTQQKTAFDRFQRFKVQVLGNFNFRFEKLIVNKFSYSMGSFLPTENELCSSYGFSENEFITIPYSQYGWQAENENTTLLDYKEKNVIQAIEAIAEFINFLLSDEKPEVGVKKSIKPKKVGLFNRLIIK